MDLTQEDFEVTRLGECTLESPLVKRESPVGFASDERRVRFSVETGGPPALEQLSFESAGPREKIYFDPANTTAAVVTCGGLAPGLNSVIRSVYQELSYNYGVERVLGLREGYRGLIEGASLPPLELSRKNVHHIQDLGGTILGSSRGHQDPAKMVDFLEAQSIDILFCVGGDGTQRGAHALHQEVKRRGLSKAIVGIPKTIDNDIPFVWLSFGYVTALTKAEEVLRAAHIEAHGAPNGIGIVKLMGRDAGFIAAGAAVASQEANFVLVPEVPFPLDGFLDALRERVVERGHALVVVAEGAGQEHLGRASDARDASGNLKHGDIGVFLRDAIKQHFADAGVEASLKYFDPAYLIRSIPANAWDRVLSDRMARSAVHAAMAGRTDTLVGFHHGVLMHVPISTVTEQTKVMELTSDLWRAVLSATGQPSW